MWTDVFYGIDALRDSVCECVHMQRVDRDTVGNLYLVLQTGHDIVSLICLPLCIGDTCVCVRGWGVGTSVLSTVLKKQRGVSLCKPAEGRSLI